MTRCEASTDPWKFVRKALAASDGKSCRLLIDEPADKELASFLRERAPASCVTIEYLLNETARLLANLYRVVAPRRVVEHEALLADACMSLEQTYWGVWGKGIDALLYDAQTLGDEAIRHALSSVANEIKTARRKDMLWRAVQAAWQQLPWNMQCETAVLIQERWKDILPLPLRDASPHELVRFVPSVIMDYAATDDLLRGIFHP
ncbi:MAG: hypothetical protein IT365_04445 [Candidatus Hydrogenedentes bacterium]|nr:hypothetical protein [Candidatus Hydrogenedentota bacterium]